jgi:hypothetical protein
MEVQEFAPRHLVAQLAFEKNQAAVVDRRGELAGELHELMGTSSASLDATAAEATTRDGMSKYRIGMGQLLAVLHIDGFKERAEDVERFFQRGLELLSTPRLTRAVAHTSYVAAVPSFEELRDALLEGLAASPAQLREMVGSPLSDVGFSFDFRDDNAIVELRIGPMRDSELGRFIEAPEDVVFPDASLFLDVKVVLRAEDTDRDPLELWRSALKRNRLLGDRLSTWLTEAVA